MATRTPSQSAVDDSPAAAAVEEPLRKGTVRLIRQGALACSVVLIAVGTAVLTGWAVHSEALMSVLPDRVSMKPNTALCFFGSGVSLYFMLAGSAWSKRWSRVAAALVSIVAGLSLCEYLFRVELGVDEALFRDIVPHAYPGRMSEVTSIGFCVAGTALLLLQRGRGWRIVSQGLGLLLSALAFVSIVGYVYGVPVFYGAARSGNSMALHTGLSFLLLGFGIVLEPAESSIARLLGSRERGGWLVRRFLPALIVLPTLMGYVYQRPGVNFRDLRFGMALFDVTLVLGGTLVLLLVGVFLNRVEERQAEMARVSLETSEVVARSERELRLVTDHLPLLLSYFDLDGRYLRVNRTYEEWLGLPAKKIVGRTIREILGEEYWGRTLAAREAAERGGTGNVETMYPTVNGDRRALVTYAPDLNEAGVVRGFACMILDVEDQRRAEEALRQSEKLAAVGRLASSIAHEINNPIDAAMNLLFLVREDVQDQGLKNLLDTAEGELKRVASIAGQTLGFHKQKVFPELVAASDLYDSVLTLHEGRLRHQGIRVERRERAVERVECIEGEIRQVLNNLVSNAVDAMGHGGRLMLRSRGATDWRTGRRGVMLTVADDGSGMDTKTLARVFEAFFTTKGVAGTGLGLWISAEILGRHGSRMLVRSGTRGMAHGTVFGIFLPYVGPVHVAAAHGVEGLAREVEATGH